MDRGRLGTQGDVVPLRVLVLAERVVADAVHLALRERGLEALPQTWSRAGTGRARPTAGDAVVALMLSDLDTEERLERARSVLGEVPLAWVVLTGAPRGPLWGAVLEAGAAAVLGNATTLASVVATVTAVAHGLREPDEGERAVLVERWRTVCEDRVSATGRLDSLSPREVEVLEGLYGGASVGELAARFGVATSTVRSQVKSMLRKLEVCSQLGAVALYREHREPGEPLRPDGSGSDAPRAARAPGHVPGALTLLKPSPPST